MPDNVFWGTSAATVAGANPSVMMLGDSWLWYPIDNLAVEIGNAMPTRQVLVIGRNGAEAADWAGKARKDIDTAFRLFGGGVQALLLSGGGNDIAGSADFLRIIRQDCAQAASVEACYQTAQPDAIIAGIVGAYRAVILKFRAYNPTATVFLHNYDHAWPTGQGVFGPADWLKEPMDTADVPEDLRRPLFKDLLARLRTAQLAMAREHALKPVVVLRSAGTLPEDAADVATWWANELHPTPAGFRRLARRAFVGPIDRVMTV